MKHQPSYFDLAPYCFACHGTSQLRVRLAADYPPPMLRVMTLNIAFCDRCADRLEQMKKVGRIGASAIEYLRYENLHNRRYA